MKFPKIKNEKLKRCHIEKLDKGVCFDGSYLKDNEVALSECKNVWFNEGVLTRRPGIFTAEDNILSGRSYDGGYYYYFRNDNTDIFINGEHKKIIVEETQFDESFYVCMTHFVNSDGEVEFSGEMNFSRLDDENFYIPKSMVFYTGKPTYGGGIYALISLVNCENFDEGESVIFEINSDYSRWERVIRGYVPTVYINGRGNNYSIPAASNQVFAGTPKRLEERNILQNYFYAYYTSDGYSDSFRLPFSNIAGSVLCTIYRTPSEYTQWLIGENENYNTQTFFGVQVKMNIDREKGVIYFTVNSESFSVPAMRIYSENNIKISAAKTNHIGLDDIASATVSLSYNSKIILASGSYIFETDYDNPLYFPIDNVKNIGTSDSPVTGLCALSDSVIVFKEREIYEISLKDGRKINSSSLLADNDSVFYESDSMTVKCLSDKIGCKNKNSIVKDGKRIFWKGNDGYIYTLDSSSKKAVMISGKVNRYLESTVGSAAKTYSVRLGGDIMFVSDNEALLLKYDTEDLKSSDKAYWYLWEFPDDFQIMGAYNILNKPWFICYNTGDDIFFTATLKGEKDMCLCIENYEPFISEFGIDSRFKTCRIPLGCINRHKRIVSVSLRINAGKAKISVNNIPQVYLNNNGEPSFKTVRINTGLCDANTADITVESDSYFALYGIDIDYSVNDI